jgi:hypothetical protein
VADELSGFAGHVFECAARLEGLGGTANAVVLRELAHRVYATIGELG